VYVPVTITTFPSSLLHLKKPHQSSMHTHTPFNFLTSKVEGGGEKGHIRPNRIPSHAPDLGDIFEAAGGGERMGMGLQVLAQGLEALCGGGCHCLWVMAVVEGG